MKSQLRWLGLVLGILMAAWMPAMAQARGGRGAAPASPYQFDPAKTDPPPVVTHHTITLDGKQVNYTATVGRIPVPGANGKVEGHMFYVAYTEDNPDPSHPRPVTFSYNGGPGSDSVYVHMGGFGPERVYMNPDGTVPPPPFKIVPNQQTWLGSTDLVFVDALGTGYSRAASLEDLQRTSGVAGDLQSFSEFIRLYLYDNNRMTSPVILAGESYGTFRSAGLAGILLDHHIAVSGVVLLSSVLNMATLRPSLSDDRPYWLAMPTLATIAYEQHKIAPDLQKETIAQVAQQAEAWASSKYEHYLALGDKLQGAERTQAIAEMARFTGLPKQYLDDNNLRVNTSQFSTELLLPEKEIIGRYDGSLTGVNRNPGSGFTDYDPSDVLEIPYINQFTQYLKNDLHYKTTLEYGDRGMGGAGITGWNYGGGPGGPGAFFGRGNNLGSDISGEFAIAFAKNPAMRVMLCEGYYDQATPMFEASYSMDHLFIPPSEQSHIITKHYLSGHMIYTHDQSRAKLANDFAAFVKTLPGVAGNQ